MNGTVATNYDYSYSIAGGNAEGYTRGVHKHDGQGRDLAGAEFEVVWDANKKRLSARL